MGNYSSLSYATWEAWFGGRSGGGPDSTIGQPAVVHLISDNIYLSVEFLSWGASGGGFSYERSTPLVPEPSAGLLLLAGFVVAAGLQYRRRRLPLAAGMQR